MKTYNFNQWDHLNGIQIKIIQRWENLITGGKKKLYVNTEYTQKNGIQRIIVKMKLTINDHKHHFDSDGESLCCFTHSKTVKIDPLSAHTDFTSGFSATNNPSARMNL